MDTLRRCCVMLLIVALSLRAGVALADAGDDQYAVAAEHYAQQRWKLAVDEFSTLVTSFPEHRRRDATEFFLAEAYVQLGDYAKSAEHFRTYLSRAPQGKYARQAGFRAGESAYLAGDATAARRDLVAFLERHPDDEYAAYAIPYLGRLALDEKKLDDAEKYYQQSLEKFPNGPLADESQFALGRVAEQRGQLDKAAAQYERVAAKRASDVADLATFRRGLVKYAGQDYAGAEKLFATLPEAFPKSALAVKAQYWQALSVKAQSRWRDAAEALGQLADANREHPLAASMRFHAGDAYLAAGDAKAAVEAFNAVLAIKNAGTLVDEALLGKLKATAKLDAAAFDALAEQWTSRTTSPLYRAARRVQAQSLLERRKYDAAIAVLEPLARTVVGVDEQAAESADTKQERQAAAYLLAVAQHGAGHYDAALAEFDKLLVDAAGNLQQSATIGRASTLVRLKRFADARPALEKYLADHPDGGDAATAWSELALCHAGAGAFDAAHSAYDELTKKHRQSPSYLPTTHRLAEIAYRGGDREFATQLFACLAAEGNPPEYVARGLSGQAWCQFTGEDLAGSAATFLQLVEKFPNDPLAAEGALVRGKALEQLGQFDPALLMYRLVLDKHPESPECAAATLAAAQLYERLKQQGAAEAHYRRFLEQYPSDAKVDVALYQLAWLLRDAPATSSDEGSGQPSGGAATAKTPASDKTSTESQAARRAEAETLFERLRHEHKHSRYWSDAVFRLAETSRDRKDASRVKELVGELASAYASAVATQEASKIAPAADAKARAVPAVDAETLAHAFYLEGRLAADLNDWPTAARAMSQLAERCPESSLRLVADFWAAEAIYRQGKYDDAAVRFAEVGERAKGTKASWLGMIPLRLAQAMAQKKQWTEARTLAETIAKEYPNFAQQYEADYLIGRCLAAEGKFDEARAAYQRVTRSATGGKTETAAMAQWMIGESFFHQKEYALAIKEYLRVEILYAYPRWQAAALVQAGKAHEASSEWREATKLYARVLEKYAQTDQAGEASNRLRVVQQRIGAAAPR